MGDEPIVVVDDDVDVDGDDDISFVLILAMHST